MFYVRKTDYKKSLESDKLFKHRLPIKFYKEVPKLLAADDAKERREILYRMNCILNEYFKIPRCGLRVYDYKRPYLAGRANYWLKGQYVPTRQGMPLIKIWNFSENNRKLSSLHILNVFLHEYIHHYDYRCLDIDVGHDSGFWRRLQHLRELVFASAPKQKRIR